MRTGSRTGRAALGIALAVGLMSLAPGQAGANPGERPNSVEVGQGNTLDLEEITPFSVRLAWTTSRAYSLFSVSVAGGSAPGRIETYSGNPRHREAATVGRLEPDTTYRIEVRALQNRRWAVVGSLSVTTKAANRVEVSDACEIAEITLRRLTATEAEINIEAACPFDGLVIALIPLDGGTRELRPIYFLRPTRVFRYTFDGLDAGRAYRIRVARMDGETPTPMGDPLLFRTP